MGFAAGLRQTPMHYCILWCVVKGQAAVFFRKKHSKKSPPTSMPPCQ